MKIGIYTLALNRNYGGELQCYALYRVLSDMGHTVYRISYGKQQEILPFGKKIPTIDIADYNKLECICVGSDQVFRTYWKDPKAVRGSLKDAFLNFARDFKGLRIAYAGSFGKFPWDLHDIADNAKHFDLFKNLIKKFTAVSVREDSGVDIIRKDLEYDGNVEHVLDPTMLLPKTHYENLIKNLKGGMPDSAQGFVYCLDDSVQMNNLIKSVSTKTNTKTYKMNLRETELLYFIQGFSKCKYVITDSFHGCVFSLIFGKPFICIGNTKRGNARFDSLFKTFKCSERMISVNDIDKAVKLVQTPFNEELDEIKAEWKEKSMNFIRQYIKPQPKINDIITSGQCCGCMSCVNACPKKALTETTDEQGFYMPSFDPEACIGCKLCDKSCPVINAPKTPKPNIKSYAAKNNDTDIRMKSSSGGMFYPMMEDIIKQNGVVFGVYIDYEDGYKVKTGYSETLEGCEKFLGSKYVQTDNGNSYNDVKRFLNEGRTVLYSGTPCMIYGLKTFLKKDYEKLLTVAVLCHGVPAPAEYSDYLKDIAKDNEIINEISFRDKTNGWRKYNMRIIHGNDTYICHHSNDSYMSLFLKNKILRKSCYNCKFKESYDADLIIGDFWSIDFVDKNFNDDKGVSIVLANTEKGKQFFETLTVITKKTIKLDANAKRYNGGFRNKI